MIPLGTAASSQQLWAQSYGGTGTGSSAAHAVAVDTQGDVYVAGYQTVSDTKRDAALLKYSPEGKLLWERRYRANDAHSTGDALTAVAVDTTGNVLVTGPSDGANTGIDWLTVKFDATGKQIWSARYNDSTNGDDAPSALAVDKAGNVYITGYGSFLPNGSKTTHKEFLTIKLNSKGSLQWTARLAGQGSGDSIANGIAVDEVSNVYVTGQAPGKGTGLDYLTAKYDAKGKLLWTQGYNGQTNGDDRAVAIALDASDNVAITGSAHQTGHGLDIVTIKYSTDGHPLWMKDYNGPGSKDDQATAIVVDLTGNTYVTGSTYVNSQNGYDAVTLCYDINGRQTWLTRYDSLKHGDDFGNGIGVDAYGNVTVVGGTTDPSTGSHVLTLRYNVNGHIVWTSEFNSSVKSNDMPAAIVLDNLGAALVVGAASTAVGGSDLLTIKYKAAPANVPISFNKPVVYTIPSSNDGITAADINGDGFPDVLITGNQEVGVLYGNGDGTLGKYQTFFPYSGTIFNEGIADFNGDGRPDVLVNEGPGTLGILYNQGKGRFAKPYTIQVGPTSGIFIGDLNRDGRLDLAVAAPGNGPSGSVTAYLNKGDGTFAQGASISQLGIVEGVYGADVNGDGNVDLAVSYETGTLNYAGVAIFYGDGKGHYRKGPFYNVGTGNMNAPTLVDLNGDGKPDLLVCDVTGYDICVLMNNGDGTFGGLNRLPTVGYPQFMQVVDLNGDGYPDVVTQSGGNIMVFRNRGDGTFFDPVTFTTGSAIRTFTVVDLNGDGKLDIVAQSPGDNSISVFINNSQP